jgi:hypothetical protein
MAVGSGPKGPLAEVWNGSVWTVRAPPAPPTGFRSLNAVSCTSPSACTAVGSQYPVQTRRLSSVQGALAERWNGTAWTIQATPDPPYGSNTVLDSISCASLTDCTAVGTNSSVLRAQDLTLAEHWDGTTWAIQPTLSPSIVSGPGAGNALYSVSCPAPSACVAVGYYTATWIGLGGIPRPLAETSSGWSQ